MCARSPVGESFQLQCLQFHPRDTDHIYAGTDTVSQGVGGVAWSQGDSESVGEGGVCGQ